MDELPREPDAQLVIAELETLKILTDPLRTRLITLLRGGALTASQLAEQIALPVKKLYYHLGLLERHGTIRVVRTRVVSGITEKTYRASAHVFLFEKEVFAPVDDELPPGLAQLFDSTRTELTQSYTAGSISSDEALPGALHYGWNFRFVDEGTAAQFAERLDALYREFYALPDGPRAGTAYRLFYTFFPTTHPGDAP